MKKKQPRYDRNAGSAGTTDSDGTMSRPGEGGVAMGGGNKDAPSTNVGTTANDMHHNTSTPCCNLLAAIAGEIILFPSTNNIISPTNDACSSNDARTTTTTPTTTTTATATITLDEQSKIMQPLLGRMILNHLLNERRERLRAVDCSEGGKKNIMSSSIPPPSSDALDSSDIMSLRSTSSKNKKKGQKKKKKKNKGGGRINRSDETEEEGEDNTIATVRTTTFLVPTVVVEEGEEMEEEEEEKKQPSLSYDHNIDSLLENGDMTTTTTTTTTENIHHKRPVGSSTPSTTKIHDEILFNQPTTNLDTLLDELMDSTSSSSCHSSCGGASADTMENRNLESFTMYLKNKFEQQHHHQQHDKSRGGGSNSSSRSKTSSTSSSSSSPPPATASSTTAPVVRGGMEYKDILPTVSITKANELTQYIDCRKCRTSTIGALRTMTASNEFSLTLCEDNNNTNNARTTMLNHHHHKNNFSSSSSTSRLAVPISGNSRSSVHDDIDLAFSYVNMDDDDFDLEVGRSSSSSSSVPTTNGRMMIDESIFQLVLHTIGSAASDKDRYLQIGCLLSSQTTTSSTNTTTTTTEICDTNGNDTIDFSFPLCTDTIINLIKHIILPRGLVEAVGSTEGFGENNDHKQQQQQQLGNAELVAIAKEACDHVDVFQAFFANADTSLLQMEEVMDRAIEKDTERSVFSPIVWKLLQEGDEKCNDLSRQLATLMMNVFKLSCFVGWSAKCGDAIMAYVKRIWDMYLKRLIQLSTLTSTYHNQLLKMSNGGAIQQVYSNKVARDLLVQFIGNKVDMLKELVLDLKSNLFGEEESISSVVELCVLRAHRNHVERIGSELERIFVDQENEDMIKELINTQINLSQRTHYSPCADDLKDKMTDQRNGFINFSRTVRTRIILIEDLALKTKKDFLGSHYNMSQDIYYDISKEIERLPSSRTNGGDIDEIIDDSSLPLKQSHALIMQMLAVLTSRQRNESLMGSLDIPPRLELWADFAVKRAKYYDTVKGDMKGTITSYFPDDSKEVLDNCDGGSEGGMRRISSIFAGLVYRWLEARCSEWHAELTRDELLESMDMEVSAVTAEGGIKGKKKKKTNRKTGGLNKGKNKDEQPSIPVTVSNSIPVVDNVNDAILPLPSSTPHIDSIPIDHVSGGDMSIGEESKDDEPLVKYPQFSGQDTAQLSGGKIGVNKTVDDNNASAVKSNMTKNELSSEVSVAVIEGATTKCIKKKKSNRNKKKEERAVLSNVIVNSSTTANVVTPSSSSSNGHIRSFDGVPLDGFIDPKQEEYVKKLLNKFEPSSTIHQISENNNIAKVISMDMNVPLTTFEGSVKGSKEESRSKLGGSNKDTNANNQVSIVTPLSSPTPLSNSKAFDHHDAKIAFSVEETKEDDDSNQMPAVRRRKRDRRKKNKVVGNPENNVEVNATGNGVLKNTKFDYCKPSVGIVDGDTFISAETYLVNRLQKILDEMDYIASLKMPVII